MSTENKIPVIECKKCKALGFPPLYVCRKCGSTELCETEIEGNGTVYTHTTIRVAPDAYRDQAPYDIAIIELNPELRVTARLTTGESDQIRIGGKVQFDHVDGNGYWFKSAS